MNGEPTMQPAKIRAARQKVTEALAAGGGDPQAIEALQASLEVLTSLAGNQPEVVRSSAIPSISYTFEEVDGLGRREFDVRIYYGWTDYDPADEPSPIWGAHIEDVEVVAVRYFDRDGEQVDWQTHAGVMAWDQLELEHHRVLSACTNDGALRGLGRVHPLFVPEPARPALQADSSLRMAPSVRTRTLQLKPRFFG